jgi:hypothetical protein
MIDDQLACMASATRTIVKQVIINAATMLLFSHKIIEPIMQI